MRVALFVTCLVDLLRPAVGFAALRLLEHAACRVTAPAGQTCCGQPAWSMGDGASAAALAKKTIAELEDCDYVVIPSGSCADHVVNVYPALLADDPPWAARAGRLAEKTYELTAFLADVLQIGGLPGAFAGSVTYHDSCKGLRGLGIAAQPRRLLASLPGLDLREMPECAECCGFGGAFAVQFPEVSAAIADEKCRAIAATGAQAVAGGDVGCLLNIEGRLRRLGDTRTRVLHVAEILAGQDGRVSC